jgi:hypothetical protein
MASSNSEQLGRNPYRDDKIHRISVARLLFAFLGQLRMSSRYEFEAGRRLSVGGDLLLVSTILLAIEPILRL